MNCLGALEAFVGGLIVTEEFAKVLNEADEHDDRRARHAQQENSDQGAHDECCQMHHALIVLRHP